MENRQTALKTFRTRLECLVKVPEGEIDDTHFEKIVTWIECITNLAETEVKLDLDEKSDEKKQGPISLELLYEPLLWQRIFEGLRHPDSRIISTAARCLNVIVTKDLNRYIPSLLISLGLCSSEEGEVRLKPLYPLTGRDFCEAIQRIIQISHPNRQAELRVYIAGIELLGFFLTSPFFWILVEWEEKHYRHGGRDTDQGNASVKDYIIAALFLHHAQKSTEPNNAPKEVLHYLEGVFSDGKNTLYSTITTEDAVAYLVSALLHRNAFVREIAIKSYSKLCQECSKIIQVCSSNKLDTVDTKSIRFIIHSWKTMLTTLIERVLTRFFFIALSKTQRESMAVKSLDFLSSAVIVDDNAANPCPGYPHQFLQARSEDAMHVAVSQSLHIQANLGSDFSHGCGQDGNDSSHPEHFNGVEKQLLSETDTSMDHWHSLSSYLVHSAETEELNQKAIRENLLTHSMGMLEHIPSTWKWDAEAVNESTAARNNVLALSERIPETNKKKMEETPCSHFEDFVFNAFEDVDDEEGRMQNVASSISLLAAASTHALDRFNQGTSIPSIDATNQNSLLNELASSNEHMLAFASSSTAETFFRLIRTLDSKSNISFSSNQMNSICDMLEFIINAKLKENCALPESVTTVTASCKIYFHLLSFLLGKQTHRLQSRSTNVINLATQLVEDDNSCIMEIPLEVIRQWLISPLNAKDSSQSSSAWAKLRRILESHLAFVPSIEDNLTLIEVIKICISFGASESNEDANSLASFKLAFKFLSENISSDSKYITDLLQKLLSRLRSSSVLNESEHYMAELLEAIANHLESDGLNSVFYVNHGVLCIQGLLMFMRIRSDLATSFHSSARKSLRQIAKWCLSQSNHSIMEQLYRMTIEAFCRCGPDEVIISDLLQIMRTLDWKQDCWTITALSLLDLNCELQSELKKEMLIGYSNNAFTSDNPNIRSQSWKGLGVVIIPEFFSDNRTDAEIPLMFNTNDNIMNCGVQYAGETFHTQPVFWSIKSIPTEIQRTAHSIQNVYYIVAIAMQFEIDPEVFQSIVKFGCILLNAQNAFGLGDGLTCIFIDQWLFLVEQYMKRFGQIYSAQCSAEEDILPTLLKMKESSYTKEPLADVIDIASQLVIKKREYGTILYVLDNAPQLGEHRELQSSPGCF